MTSAIPSTAYWTPFTVSMNKPGKGFFFASAFAIMMVQKLLHHNRIVKKEVKIWAEEKSMFRRGILF